MPTYFQNPANRYIVKATGSFWWLWAFLFGPFYFAYKGLWGHAVLYGISAIVTLGVSWLIYPFFAGHLVRSRYREMGWLETSPDHERSMTTQRSHGR